jgi:WD40 repeat protein
MIRGLLLFCLSFSLSAFAQTHPVEFRSLLVCGGTYVHLVDPAQSREGMPHIIWTWDAREVNDLPEQYRNRYFNSVDDAKPVRGGNQLLISSSSGGVVLWDLKENRCLFHAFVPNAHSIEMLPCGLIAAASSTHKDGNILMLFDQASEDGKPVATDPLHSAHGVVWHEKRQTLFALGFDVLREYKVEDKTLRRLKEWNIPGEGGHDLTLSPDLKRFFLTEHTGAWQFDLETETFSVIPGFPNAENIKSLNLALNGQYLYTVPEESWWTHHVSLHRPDQRLAFPDLKVYKARWYRE